MDLIMCTSRGKNLESFMNHHHDNPLISTRFIVRSGSPILNLAKEATHIINHSPIPNSQIHVYFIAGLIEITEKITDTHYQEIIFNDSYFHTESTTIPIFQQCADIITTTNARPCFATITPMHIETWNNIRLQQNHTSYLLHHNQYESMQYNLNKATAAVNQRITELNIANNMQTPRLAQHCFYKPQSRKLFPKFRHHLLPDGIHLSNDLKEKWTETLALTISVNRIMSSPHIINHML